MSSVLLVFLDGIGLGDPDATRNAFVAEPPATMSRLLDGALLTRRDQPFHATKASLAPLDATLGVPGLPQSGTGHFTLFTGENGAQLFGRHYGPWVPTRLREPLQRDNLLTRVSNAGRRVAFANAYPEELIDAAHSTGGFRPIGPLRSGPPLVAAGAGVLTRHTPALLNGDAVSSEIVNDGWRENLRRLQLPIISPRTAGSNLARIANAHDLTLFAHYTTDYEGHQQELQVAVAAIRRVDEFVAGVIAAIDDDVVVIIASDHGNLEDATTGHTYNPALGMVIGKEHESIAERMRSLVDVAKVVEGVATDK